ncbi:hypothetical protein [Virgisporangium aurantiacum]|uniref:Uncharacterized protein n=1 Tax=Virgisporangium aurantiacum TaxID=175570 RepID=A0A8J4E5E6_9ACTN|nr:hypothetical protein [Virgisporangium aurantiacum]GIJ62980.1 hypothetical protein Vau01_104960 [Virgisporangium aurantiacum]
MAGGVLQWLAVRRWPVGVLATAWVGRRALRASADESRVGTLIEVMTTGRSAAARTRAAATLERLWEGRSPAWERIWDRILAVLRDDDGFDPAIGRFLLGADPACAHEPRLRVVAGMAQPFRGLNASTIVVRLGLRPIADPDLATGFRDVLHRTDEPSLLGALEFEFVEGLWAELGLRVARQERHHRLWTDDGTPTPLLEAILTNPHLPRPVDRPDRSPDLAVLMVLRDRTDLITGFDPVNLVKHLLDRLTHGTRVPRHRGGISASTACGRALTAQADGPVRIELARRAVEGDETAARYAAAGGFVPADPDLVPLFLIATRQFHRLDDADPDGRRLAAFPLAVGHAEMLLRVVNQSGVPPTVRAACVRALAAARAVGVRDLLCRRAEAGDRAATEVVVAGGHLPSDPRREPAFLFLTRQWDRYDAADPDGSRLRAYAPTRASYSEERRQLRRIAREAGRPDPGDPHRQLRGGGRGHGVAGSGGYADTGGYGDGGGYSGGGFSCGGHA